MDSILEIAAMTKQIENFQLENINIRLEPGYIMGLIGPNGSGKTTLILTLLGLYQPKEGNIKICGYDLAEQEKEAKSQIGFVLDESPFTESISSKENARLYGRYYPHWDQNTFDRYCRQFEVDLKKPLKKLSKGNKIKFQLAFALSHNAKLLVFDEPTAGLDPVFRREIIEIMCDVISEGERGILFSTHLTEELDKIADYITFLQNGKQLFSLSKEELMERYSLVRGSGKQIGMLEEGLVIGKRIGENFAEALIRKDLINLQTQLQFVKPTIEDIMYYTIQSMEEC
jgi:ABC-2 type transport system ATP-binding protein